MQGKEEEKKDEEEDENGERLLNIVSRICTAPAMPDCKTKQENATPDALPMIWICSVASGAYVIVSILFSKRPKRSLGEQTIKSL